MNIASIILNFRRPQNIPRIVSSLAAGLPGRPVFLLDQAETPSLRFDDEMPWQDVWYRKPAKNGRAGARIALAAEMPFDFYLAIDDDMFLSAEQISRLATKIAADSMHAHGILGRRMERNGASLTLGEPLVGQGRLSVIHSVYGFSRDQALRVIQRSRQLGFAQWSDVKFGDDLLISSASDRPAMCHDLGAVRVCGSYFADGVAVSKEGQFDNARRKLTQQLLDIKALATFPLSRDEDLALRPARDHVIVEQDHVSNRRKPS